MTYTPRRRALEVLAAGAFLLALAGCGGGGAGSSEGKPKVLVLLPSLQDESYVRQQAGAQAEAEKHGDISVQVDAGTSRSSATSIVNKIETAVTKGTDVIAINPGAFGNEVRPALERAADQGVDVLAFDQTVPDMPELKTYVEVDVGPGAVEAGNFMAKQLSSGAEIGVIRCFAGNPVMDARMDGFEQGTEGSNISIASTLDAKCDPAKARSNMENMLSANPELAGVFSDTDVALMGALEALKAENDDPVVIGFDGQKPALEAIANGQIIDATVTNPFEETGMEAVRQAAKIASGEDVPKTVPLETRLIDSQQEAREALDKINQLAS